MPNSLRFLRCAGLAATLSLLWGNVPQLLAVEFQSSIEKTRQSDKSNRPMVVSFGAPWCGWCRKMEAETFSSAEVQAIQDKYLWVKVDVDEQPEVAARYEVEGLPRTLLIDPKGRVIGSLEGYVSSARFVKFLNESLANPLPGNEQIDELSRQLAQAVDDAEVRKSVVGMVELLSRPKRIGRDELLAALKQHQARSRPVLLELMADERLAIRAAAAGCLKHCLQNELAFDPFASPEARAAQLTEWRKAIAVRVVPMASGPEIQDHPQAP